MITNHTQLLNALIEKYNLKSYLEIGVQNPANNFDKINCEIKTGVDPTAVCKPLNGKLFCIESDAFFTNIQSLVYDLIFIDGLHHAEQVKRDFENSLRCLSDNGFIVIHDVLPENEAGTIVPRETKQWWGDVYMWAMSIGQYDGIRFKTFDIDNGCMLVWKDKSVIIERNYVLPENINWRTYTEYGKSIMNVTSTVEI